MGKKTLCLFVLGVLWAATAVLAEDLACNPIPIKVGEVELPQAFQDATKIRVVTFDPTTGALSEVAGFEFDVSNKKWQVDAPALQKLNTLRSSPDRTKLLLIGVKNGQLDANTRSPFLLDGESRDVVCKADKESVTGSSALGPWQECQDQFVALDTDIRTNRVKNDKYTAIVFMPDGKVCGQSRPFGVAGDLIYTAVYDDGTVTSEGVRVEFTKCDTLGTAPKNPELEALLTKFTFQAKGVKRPLFEFPPRQCFGTTADMRVKAKIKPKDKPEKDIDVPYSLQMYERFRYTLQVGVIQTDQRSQSFGVRDSKIFSKGPTGRGPEALATVVLYSLPRYFSALRGKVDSDTPDQAVTRVYYGRDVIHEQGFADRIGFLLGAGLNNPNERFGLGLSFEIGYGINLIGMYENAKVKGLGAGLKEGDSFTGTAEQLPTRETWERGWVFGVSIDMRYITGLFKRAS